MTMVRLVNMRGCHLLLSQLRDGVQNVLGLFPRLCLRATPRHGLQRNIIKGAEVTGRRVSSVCTRFISLRERYIGTPILWNSPHAASSLLIFFRNGKERICFFLELKNGYLWGRLYFSRVAF